MENKKLKTSKDLHLTAYLIAAGLELEDSFWDGKTCYFLIREHPDIARIERGYWNGDGQVGGRAFADSLRRLQDIIHNSKNG